MRNHSGPSGSNAKDAEGCVDLSVAAGGAGVSATRLLFVVTEDWYFCSHRLQLAVAALAAGYDVSVVTRVREHGDQIRRAGVKVIPFENTRTSLNPLRDLWATVRLIMIYRRERPDIVHHVAIKPVVYGTIAARMTRIPRVVNALAGMGWLLTPSAGVGRWFKSGVRLILGRLLQSGIALVQNRDDALMLERLGVPGPNIRIIPGSGVDLAEFVPRPEPDGAPLVLLAARLLWDKGIGEFVASARLLREKGMSARFVLAGEPDPANPAAIPPDQVAKWAREGVVEHLGWVVDMPALLAKSHIVALPSYREGLPKCLLEAAAAGLPIVTTDVPGCRDVVRDGENGFLVPVRDVDGLAAALARLIESAELRKQMGAQSRLRAEQEFGLDAVVPRMLALYAERIR